MNNLEKHIVDNKEKLEHSNVDSKVWLSIENAVLKQRQRRTIKFGKIFLLAVTLVASVAFYFMNADGSTTLNEEMILADLNLTQHNFTQQVNYKKQQLVKATVPKENLADVQILLQQLEFMDGQFQDYRLYIEQNGYQEFIGEQILNFYKTKIELLDRIQHEVEKINYYESIQPSHSDMVSLEI